MADTKDMENILNEIFTFSKLSGTFPFILKHGTIRISLLLILFTTLFYSLVVLLVLDDIFELGSLPLVLHQSVLFLNIQLFLTPASNLIWLSIKSNKMKSFVCSILNMHKMVQIKMPLSMWFKIFSLACIFFDLSINIVKFVILVDQNAYGVFKSIAYTVFTFLPILAIVDQFSSLLDFIRMIFVEACNQLNAEKVEELIEVVELLRKSCSELNHCYDLQLLMFLLTSVIFEVTIIYIFVAIPLGSLIDYLTPAVAFVFFTSAILRLTMSCWRVSLKMLSVITTCTLLMVQFGN
ncbi:Gustatory receptor 92d [Halyomorpha halys]|nr:Gustatory receptor 92d [Halyomorpha halys]